MVIVASFGLGNWWYSPWLQQANQKANVFDPPAVEDFQIYVSKQRWNVYFQLYPYVFMLIRSFEQTQTL